jgi:IPT/TIG domain
MIRSTHIAAAAAGTALVLGIAGTGPAAAYTHDCSQQFGPCVSSVNPDPVSSKGGTAVTVAGPFMNAVSFVRVGTAPTAIAVTQVSQTSFRFVAPAHSVGTVTLTLLDESRFPVLTVPGGLTFKSPPVLGFTARAAGAGRAAFTIVCTPKSTVKIEGGGKSLTKVCPTVKTFTTVLSGLPKKPTLFSATALLSGLKTTKAAKITVT